MTADRRGAHNGRIGAWRLFDVVATSLTWRAAFIGGGMLMPRRGPADPARRAVDPAAELPDSYLSEREQQYAMQRERARRSVGAAQRRARA
ncbi:MAG: hypothetical protein IVW36_12185 [Dehalococcoidia bacterium]|nr:hypothetical protein [Dehalococcoidia bacterium]